METKSGKKRNKLVTLLLVLVIAAVVCVGGWLILFRLNQFSLVVQLRGDGQPVISQGEFYEDPGAEVRLVGSLFFRDGILLDLEPLREGTVDTTQPGNYEIRYDASFYHWSGSAARRVLVLDTMAPEITLFSIPNHVTIHGETYVDEGYSAWDLTDGDLTDRVVRREENGFVTYTVFDEAGNQTTVRRKIVYVDYTAPELVLLGEQTVYVTSGETYTEPGWTAMDNVDGDLHDRVKTTGTVDKYLAGSYQIIYTVKDNSGNSTEITRTVVVQGRGIPETVRPAGNVIYLTFDDGPGPWTEYVLKTLARYDAKATFFVVNTDFIDDLEAIAEAGHSIGIHSVTHTYREIYADSDAYFNDLLTMQQIIYEKTGVTTYLMRFPGGSSNTVSRFNPGIMTYLTQAVEDMGFRYFDWNVDSNDAGGAKDAEEVYENVIAGVQNQRISIVLQHDIKDISVAALERILQWGKANGYQFLGLDMTSPTAHHGVNN